jgi:hypothetical protein
MATEDDTVEGSAQRKKNPRSISEPTLPPSAFHPIHPRAGKTK